MMRQRTTIHLARLLLGFAAAGCFWASAAAAGSYYVAVDVPTLLDGTDYRINECVLNDNGIHSLAEVLPDDAALGALHREPDGSWMFVPSRPVTLDGTDYTPRDVVGYDGVSFSLLFAGAAAGIPDYARIDALMFAAPQFLLSFDVPVNLGGTEYEQSDFVAYDGGYLPLFDASVFGVPPQANLVGASIAVQGTLIDLLLTFDIPVTLGGTTYLPGSVIRWNGAVFSPEHVDAAWPPGSQLSGLSFLPAAGALPDGAAFPGTQLSVDKATGDDVTLSWGESCAGSDDDYAVYEGTLGDFASHSPSTCSTGGNTTQTLTPGTGSVYFLVVPRNDYSQGSYGLNSAGDERPQLPGACLPQQPGACS